jgi:predicted transcriptional regulator
MEMQVMEGDDKVVPLRPATAEAEPDRKSLERRWTKTVLGPGFTQIPSVLLRAQARLHLSPIELNVLLQMIDHWWDSDDMPFPAKKRLAERMGVSEKTIQRAVSRLVEEGLIRRTARHNRYGGQTSSLYDLTPLVEKLTPIAEDMLKAREDAKVARRLPERPGHRIRAARKAES